LLRAQPSLTHKALSQRIGISANGIKYHLAKLREAGVIRHVGPTKAGRWEVLK
jgi:ATP-dependent DNA helicase RecG